MKITSAEFIKGIRGTDPVLYDGVPQIAFVGRSNVGKSSVINSLVNKKDLVKVGKKPGKTTELNFFHINKSFYFVDLPGYGYAKVSPEQKEKIRKMILWYLMYSEVKPRIVVLILDIAAGFTAFDRELVTTLQECNHPYMIVANKADKLNQKEIAEQLGSIIRESGISDVIVYSAKTKKGGEELFKKIFS